MNKKSLETGAANSPRRAIAMTGYRSKALLTQWKEAPCCSYKKAETAGWPARTSCIPVRDSVQSQKVQGTAKVPPEIKVDNICFSP